LRFLEDGTFKPVGGTQKKASVRILAATNKDLLIEVQKKNFREDLYYRLAKFRIRTLPLKKRREDIICLVNHFQAVAKLTKETAKKRYLLYACSLPGNVRQLLDLYSPHTELKDIEEEMVNCILNLAKNLGLHTDKERFDDLPMRKGAIEKPVKDDHSSKLLESISGNARRKGEFRELSFLSRVLGSLKNHPNIIKSVRAYEAIVLAQETCLSREEIAETLTIRKNDLMGKNFKSAFGFEYPANQSYYYVLHPYDAYPEPYQLHGSKAPGPDFYTRYGYFPL
jgi:DNA-binding NtrC family response regulator